MARQKGTPAKPPANGAAPAVAGPERLPAYFLSLSVENVRCFGPRQTLDLSDGHGKPAPWTIILGLNGTGKTTLLQALAGFEVIPSHRRISGEEDYGDSFLRFVRLPYWTFTRGGEVDSRVSSVITLTRQLDAPASDNGFVGVKVTSGDADGEGSVLGVFGQTDTLCSWCCAYGAGRRVASTSLSEVALGDSTASLFSDTAPLRNSEEWLLQLDYATKGSKSDKEAQRRFALAKELLISIMPEDEITDIRCVPGSGPNPKARVEFQTPYGWVPLRQLGYGYQTLITWVADLANRMAERYPDSPNPLHEPAVVLVDEIDLHLHPQWQRKLMGFLRERFPNTQFIATAHSPLVAQAAADANLAVLRREGDHVVIDNEVDNIRNWRIDQILTSDLFGLKTARPPQVEAMLDEREKLLVKSKLTAADKKRLGELDELIGDLPFGETKQEREERAAIKQALDVLMKERKPAS